jgi:hypothetical protein
MVSACMQSSFIFMYFCCLFACNKSFLDQPVFMCDAWSRSLGRGREFYPNFRVDEKSVGWGFLTLRPRLVRGLGPWIGLVNTSVS